MRGVETRLIGFGLCAVVYLSVAKAGFLPGPVGGQALPMSPAAGFCVALLFSFGVGFWPGVWLGASVAAVISGVPPLAAAAIGAGGTLEAGVLAHMLRPGLGSAEPYRASRHAFLFSSVSGLASATAALIGTLALRQVHRIAPDVFVLSWATWWLGNWAGILVLVPLFLSWREALRTRLDLRTLAGDLWALAAAAASGLVLLLPDKPAALHEVTPLLLLSSVAVASFHLDRRRVQTILLAFAAVAIVAARLGRGPFDAPGPGQALLVLQSFLVILSLTGLIVSWRVAERLRVEAALRCSHRRLKCHVEQRDTALHESEKTFARLFHSSPIALAVNSVEEGRYVLVNDSFLRLLGCPREEVIGRASWEIGVFSGPDERERMRTRLLADGRLSDAELTVRTKSGEERDCLLSAEMIEIGGTRRFLTSLRDVSDTRRAEKLIAHLAYHDPLTGLPNRLLFQDRFDQAILHARRQSHMLGILFVDIDRFKSVNDSLGHAAGDRFLRRVAERLVRSVRACDTVVRLGGDEFVVLLDGIQQPEDAGRVARKILDNLARPYEIDNREFFTTASVGASVYPVDGTDADTLLRHADTAMYGAKSLGGDVFRAFAPTMNRRASERLGLDAELHRAVRSGEFVVYYQPQLSLDSNRIECVEALVRWRHPTRGLLLPRSFMRIAEETGLVVPIDFFVFRQACRDLVTWRGAGLPPVKVAVNVSLRQFQQADLASRLREVIAETGVDPALLDLEINERVALSTVRSHRGTIADVKRMGLRLSLDDFGHGHSTLSHLRELPIETVKIDRSFIRKSARDPRDAAIARALISMAHTLRMRVVAEGVDNLPLLGFLRDEGCDAIQGFCFSRPVPAPMLEELLTTWGDDSSRARAA